MSHPGQDSPQDLAAAYALGALSAEEAQRFEAFLATSPETQREVAEFRDVAALLALDSADAAPAGDLRDRVLTRVGSQKSGTLTPSRVSASPGPSRAVWGALAASVLLAIGLGAGLVGARGRITQLQAALTGQEETLASTRQQLQEREATLNSILEPGVELFQLTASGDPEPGIQIFWDRQRNRALAHGFKLKQVPEGRAYQLWFIKDGKPVPSVTFKPEPSGQVRVEKIPVPTGAVSAAAITLEPEGGSQQPTSPILLVGALKKS
jgi:anti-sigma-K factor RskA